MNNAPGSVIDPPLSDSSNTNGGLAVFDLDGTLIRGDSFIPFVVGYARSRRRIRPLLTLPVWVGLYAARLLADHRAKQRVLVSFFRGEPRTVVAEYATEFTRQWIMPRIVEPIHSRLTWHLSLGHRVILLSASPDIYVEAVGNALGIDEVICTRIRGTPNHWDGTLDGLNCKGDEKLNRLWRHLGTKTWPAETYAYGDSQSDLPVLRWARHGFLVNRQGRMQSVDPLTKKDNLPLPY